MKRTKATAGGAIGLTVALLLSACSGTAAPGGPNPTGDTGDGGDKEISVWFMEGQLPEDQVDSIVKQFKEETGATANVEIQQWEGINTKLITALATDSPPDVMQIGNTNAPLFAATGGLEDLSPNKKDFYGSDTWLNGLAGPATVDGNLYAVPLAARSRAVLYNQKMWEDAGINEEPQTFEELTNALDKIKAAHSEPDFSPLYLAGVNWYIGLMFLYDAGGSVAKQVDGKWVGQLSTPESLKGLAQWVDFQNKYSSVASRTVPSGPPTPATVLGTGKAASMIDSAGSINAILKTDPELEGHIGSFTMPSQNNPGGNMPAFLGGSVMGMAKNSENKKLGLEFLKLLTSESMQAEMVVTTGNAPGSEAQVEALAPTVSEFAQPFWEAAKKSVAVPPAPGWATLESDGSPSDFFSQLTQGKKSIEELAKDFDAHITKTLNATN